MVTGDVIANNFLVAIGANTDFQPAAGVEIVLTMFGIAARDANGRINSQDGVTPVTIMLDGSNMPIPIQKFFISNADYVNFSALVAEHSFFYCGIQTQ